jgi:hypothetical protein
MVWFSDAPIHLPSVLCWIQCTLWLLGSHWAEPVAHRALIWQSCGGDSSTQKANSYQHIQTIYWTFFKYQSEKEEWLGNLECVIETLWAVLPLPLKMWTAHPCHCDQHKWDKDRWKDRSEAVNTRKESHIPPEFQTTFCSKQKKSPSFHKHLSHYAQRFDWRRNWLSFVKKGIFPRGGLWQVSTDVCHYQG